MYAHDLLFCKVCEDDCMQMTFVFVKCARLRSVKFCRGGSAGCCSCGAARASRARPFHSLCLACGRWVWRGGLGDRVRFHRARLLRVVGWPWLRCGAFLPACGFVPFSPREGGGVPSSFFAEVAGGFRFLSPGARGCTPFSPSPWTGRRWRGGPSLFPLGAAGIDVVPSLGGGAGPFLLLVGRGEPPLPRPWGLSGAVRPVWVCGRRLRVGVRGCVLRSGGACRVGVCGASKARHGPGVVRAAGARAWGSWSPGGGLCVDPSGAVGVTFPGIA